jgi:uncharacterized GH25 family protein
MYRLLHQFLPSLIFVVVAVTTTFAHDLFLRPDIFRVAPGGAIAVKVFSGTFSRSENAITRDRLADLSLVSASGRQPLDKSLWTETDPQSTVKVTVGGAGTYVIGGAVHPRLLQLDGAKFTAYLKEEGIDAILAARKSQKRLNEGSRERYSKYVKALVQAGDTLTDAYATPLGYAAELIPLANPYALKVGDTLSVRCLVDGKAVAGQVLFAGGRTPTGTRHAMQRLVTDQDGVIKVRLTAAGAWYVKLVHMRDVTGDPEANYESRWSTLTFGVQ